MVNNLKAKSPAGGVHIAIGDFTPNGMFTTLCAHSKCYINDQSNPWKETDEEVTCKTCLRILKLREKTDNNTFTVDPEKVAKLMIEKYRFDPSKENMETDRTNYSFALLDSLTELYDLEGKVDYQLEIINGTRKRE